MVLSAFSLGLIAINTFHSGSPARSPGRSSARTVPPSAQTPLLDQHLRQESLLFDQSSLQIARSLPPHGFPLFLSAHDPLPLLSQAPSRSPQSSPTSPISLLHIQSSAKSSTAPQQPSTTSLPLHSRPIGHASIVQMKPNLDSRRLRRPKSSRRGRRPCGTSSR